MKNFRENFHKRMPGAIALGFCIVIGLASPNGDIFRVLYVMACAFAVLELLSFQTAFITNEHSTTLAVEYAILACSIWYVCAASVADIVALLAGVILADAGAYFAGHLLGGRIFKKKPFPRVSPNKTWEGIFGGLIISTAGMAALWLIYGADFDPIFFCCAPCAILGDALESYLKRLFCIKDSCELVESRPYQIVCEAFLGGKGGHGGFLDRLDSTMFTATCFCFLQSTFTHL